MATSFNTQTDNGTYRLQFETDNKQHYLLMQETARKCVDNQPEQDVEKHVTKGDCDMPIEEYRRRLEEAEKRAHVAESDAAILRECIVRMSLERYGVLR